MRSEVGEIYIMRAVVVLTLITVASYRCAEYEYKYQPITWSIGSISSGSKRSEISILPAGSEIQSELSVFDIGSGLESASNVGGRSGDGIVSSIGGISNAGGSLGNVRFYTFSAPQDEFDDAENTRRVLAAMNRPQRVIFIQTPENNAINNAVLQIARKPTEDKTKYVLSKQPDIAELASHVEQISESVTQKPGFRFIKYRPHEDATTGQNNIQQQFDALGGSTRSSDVSNHTPANVTQNYVVSYAANYSTDVAAKNAAIVAAKTAPKNVGVNYITRQSLQNNAANDAYILATSASVILVLLLPLMLHI